MTRTHSDLSEVGGYLATLDAIAVEARSHRNGSADPMYPVPGLVKQAVDSDVVDATTALNGGLTVLDESRTNTCANEVQALDQLLRTLPAAKLITAARAWGISLADLHRWPTRFGTPPAAAIPWIFDLDRVPASWCNGERESSVGVVLQELRSNPNVRSALTAAGAAWSQRHWIHCDATTANAVAHPAGPYRWRVWLVGDESSGLGDPGWDLATAYESLQLLEVQGVRSHNDVRPLLSALLDGYRSGRGPGRLTPSVLVARAAMTAVQVAASNRVSTGPAIPVEPFLRRTRVHECATARS
jgi:hypothetical protein